MNFFKPNFWDKNQISFISVFLLPFSLLVRLLGFFIRLLTKEKKFSIPIICVGNIYLGGTGKTPLCIEIFSILKNLKMNPAFIRKKYDLFQDEANLQKKIGPIFQNKKRMNAINEAKQNKADIAILDDGFQDFSIRKNISIICSIPEQVQSLSQTLLNHENKNFKLYKRGSEAVKEAFVRSSVIPGTAWRMRDLDLMQCHRLLFLFFSLHNEWIWLHKQSYFQRIQNYFL